MIPEIKDFEKATLMWPAIGVTSEAEKKFREKIENKYHVKIGDYWDFHKWTIENLGEFWEEVWNFIGVKYSKIFDKVIDLNVSISERPEWFQGARLNFAENLLRYRDDRVALLTTGEDKQTGQVTYAEIYEMSQLYAAAFRKCGLKKGDVVACYMSHREEPVFAMMAVVSIGAIWTGALPFLGAQAVLNNFEQVRPRFLLTVDRFVYNREEKEMLQKVKEISEDKFALGDMAIINPITRGTIIYGRSDETLKKELFRFGSSEIYNVVDGFPEIQDSVCVSQYSQHGNERSVLFVKMNKGHSFDGTLENKIRKSVEKDLTAYHVPALILETPEIPYNLADKKMEIIVKKIINGMVYHAETVKNPGCLEFYKNIPPYEE